MNATSVQKIIIKMDLHQWHNYIFMKDKSTKNGYVPNVVNMKRIETDLPNIKAKNIIKTKQKQSVRNANMTSKMNKNLKNAMLLTNKYD